MGAEKEYPGSVTLHLLDPNQGRPVQTWGFQNRTRITIGRASGNDITLADPQVSRSHVELVYRDDRWLLCSLGRNGTRIDGAMVSETALVDRVVFQLGATGPSFQFVTTNDRASILATVDSIDPEAFDFLRIDERRKAEEVDRIADSSSFQQLQQYARRLRQTNDSQTSPTDP